MLRYVPAEEEGMAGVLNSCVSSLEGAVAACSLPPWPPAATNISPQAQVCVHEHAILCKCALVYLPSLVCPG